MNLSSIKQEGKFKRKNSPSILFEVFFIILILGFLTPFWVNAQCPSYSGTITSTQPSCYGGSDGTITVSPPTGANPPFTYYIGSTGQYNNNVFTGLAGGKTYTLSAVDSKGCTINISYGYYLGQPVALGASPYTTQSPGCNLSNGNLYANANNGTPPYTYSLDGVNYYSNGGVFTNLPAGGYTLYIKDSKNCTLVYPYTLGPLASYNLSGGGSICNGSTTTLTLSGSSSGVSYQLRNNGVNAGTAQNGNGSALTFTVSSAGTYTVLATNTSTSCTAIMNGSVVITSSSPTVYTLSGGGLLFGNR